MNLWPYPLPVPALHEGTVRDFHFLTRGKIGAVHHSGPWLRLNSRRRCVDVLAHSRAHGEIRLLVFVSAPHLVLVCAEILETASQVVVKLVYVASVVDAIAIDFLAEYVEPSLKHLVVCFGYVGLRLFFEAVR